MNVNLLVGTVKGGFLFRSDAKRSRWSLEGPLFKGWKVTASGRDRDGGYLVATASEVYGVAVQRSRDLREWRQVEKGPRWTEESGFKMNQIWAFARTKDRLYAGVDEAGLFESGDGGDSWTLVEGLSGHSTRKAWFPGFGGLCAHVVLSDPKDPKRLWCGISAVGVFRSEDGGRNWTPKNRGVTQVIEDKGEKEIGFCVHGLVQDPKDANTIWRQDHRGMYRTRDGGDRWEKIEEGLPSGFGFPIALDAKTRSLYCVPLESDEYRMPVGGKLRVYRSRDGGDSWHALSKGLPEGHAYMGVLRSAMAVDDLDPCGVYLGTTSGTIFASADAGDSWSALPGTLPRILSVGAFVES